MKCSRQLACIVFLSLITPLGVFAADVPTNNDAPSIVPQGSLLSSSVLPSCFDYYQFGSIPVNLDARLDTVSAGVPFAVTAGIKNTNNYPIVDASVYIRVMKMPVGNGKSINGPLDIVDYFPIAQNITLGANETKEVTFTWDVPKDADPGSYEMVPFVLQADRFNFLGLTFTDDITGGPYNFSIVNTSNGAVSFDRNSAFVAGQSYKFAAFSPIIPSGLKDVQIKLNVTNTTAVRYDGTLYWKLYKWDGSRDSALITQSSEPIEVPVAGTTTLSYDVTDTSHSVYYLTAQIETQDGSKSLAAIRFVRPDVDEPRLSLLDVTQYPLVPGSLAFACFHSSGSDKAENVSVQLSLKTLPVFGLFALPISSNSYSGYAPGNLVALTLPVKKGKYDSFEIVATLTQNGKRVDQVVIPYDCKVLGSCSSALTINDWAVLVVVGIALLVYMITKEIKHLSIKRKKTAMEPK